MIMKWRIQKCKTQKWKRCLDDLEYNGTRRGDLPETSDFSIFKMCRELFNELKTLCYKEWDLTKISVYLNLSKMM